MKYWRGVVAVVFVRGVGVLVYVSGTAREAGREAEGQPLNTFGRVPGGGRRFRGNLSKKRACNEYWGGRGLTTLTTDDKA